MHVSACADPDTNPSTAAWIVSVRFCLLICSSICLTAWQLITLPILLSIQETPVLLLLVNTVSKRQLSHSLLMAVAETMSARLLAM